jgi:TIR domain
MAGMKTGKTKTKASTRTSRLFLSHSAKDKNVARQIAVWLKKFGFEVWFDEWEIAVGDSIVEKVFTALSTSDVLIILLSRASVKSRWVAEELSSSVMRQLSEGGIRVLPVLCEACTIPNSLKHIKHADFRSPKVYLELLESLEPGQGLWANLGRIYKKFCVHCDAFVAQRTISFNIEELYPLLELATQVRTEIEIRSSRRKSAPRNLFDRLEFLETKGVATQSRAFAKIVSLQSLSYHGELGDISINTLLGHKARRQDFVAFLEDLKQLMKGLCIRQTG